MGRDSSATRLLVAQDEGSRFSVMSYHRDTDVFLNHLDQVGVCQSGRDGPVFCSVLLWLMVCAGAVFQALKDMRAVAERTLEGKTRD